MFYLSDGNKQLKADCNQPILNTVFRGKDFTTKSHNGKNLGSQRDTPD